jgi:two-component system chemotaxis sensor kinase CheA
MIDLILHSADYMNQCLRGVETGCEPASDGEPLIARVRAMIEGAGNSKAPPPPLAAAAGEPARPAAGNPAVEPARPAAGNPVVEPARPAAGNPEAAGGPRAVKVDTGKLDYLVDMVGELVIAQSMIQHDPDLAARSQKLTRNLAQLTRITGDVQRIAMAMRMHPVSQLFQRMARLVRDLAKNSGKQVNLELSGEDTELDRNLVEELADPLMHMIRNAVDHGAEPPEARIAAGKDPTARIDLKAYHQGGFINIEISDDGRGLMRDKILAKARQRGLSGGDNLSDQEVFSLIFEPGFSTAEQVTAVSGRGVGMDVVRKQISKLRGRIDITSRPGEGTTFILKLPLTLAIIEGLVVGVGKQRYIIPIFAVKEMFRPAPEALSTVPGGGEMVLVRGSLLPVLRLYSRFGVEPTSQEPSSGVLVVVENAHKKFCVLVDELMGKQEVVIKSLGETFKNVTGVAGGSILGDGRVGLILDVEALYGSQSGE